MGGLAILSAMYLVELASRRRALAPSLKETG